jgi:hypothetical protein
VETKNLSLKPIKKSTSIQEQVKAATKAQAILTKIKGTRPPGFKKWLPFLIISLVVLVILILVVNEIATRLKKPLPLPKPTAAPIKRVMIASPSAYATDSAILKFEDELGEIELLLKETRFRQPALLPPELDMKVNFKL